MYIDSLVRIKNALERKKERVKIPYSRLNMSILESLVKEGYLEEVSRKGRSVRRIIDVKLKYANGKPVITEIKFSSRPSRRIYLGHKDIRKSRQGYGHYFLSTSKGILPDYQARREKVGGQVLFEIW